MRVCAFMGRYAYMNACAHAFMHTYIHTGGEERSALDCAGLVSRGALGLGSNLVLDALRLDALKLGGEERSALDCAELVSHGARGLNAPDLGGEECSELDCAGLEGRGVLGLGSHLGLLDALELGGEERSALNSAGLAGRAAACVRGKHECCEHDQAPQAPHDRCNSLHTLTSLDSGAKRRCHEPGQSKPLIDDDRPKTTGAALDTACLLQMHAEQCCHETMAQGHRHLRRPRGQNGTMA